MDVLLKLRARIMARLCDAYVWMLGKHYVGKTLEVRAYTGHGRTIEKKSGVREHVREMAIRESRLIEGVTFMRGGLKFQFFLNASSPVAIPEAAPPIDLGPFASRATRATKDVRTFNVREIQMDPERGVLYVIPKG